MVSAFLQGFSSIKSTLIALVITAAMLLLTHNTPNAYSSAGFFSGTMAQDSPLAPVGDQVRFSHLTSEDGLSNNRVLSILRDNRGFMWFDATDGLNRYDPRTEQFTSYMRPLVVENR